MSNYGSEDEKEDYKDVDDMIEEEDANDEPEQSDQSEEDKVADESDQEVEFGSKTHFHIDLSNNRSMRMHKFFLTQEKNSYRWKIG